MSDSVKLPPIDPSNRNLIQTIDESAHNDDPNQTTALDQTAVARTEDNKDFGSRAINPSQ